MTIALGIDVGSTTTKVALVEVAAAVRVLRIGRVLTPDDPGALLTGIAELLRGCLAGAPGPIAAIGIASMAETGVPLAADTDPLTPFQRWDRALADDGARLHLDALLSRHPNLPRRAGLPATPKPALLALLRLRDTHPDAFAQLAQWQGVADHVAWALTGAHATDHTLAARTMLFDRTTHAWDAELLGEIGISASVLPRVVPAGTAVGATDARAAEYGLATGIPVFIAGHDHAVGAWAAGVRSPGEVADSLGTAEAVLTVSDTVDAGAVDDGFSIGRTVDDRHATVMGGSPACGALLAAWPGHPVDALAALDPSHWEPTALTVLPYPRGRQCPAPDPTARLRTVGNAVAENDRERAVLEGLVLHARWMRTAMTAHTGHNAERVTILGSLTSRVPAWAPLAAAAAGIPFDRCTTPEPVAAGSALLAAVRAGVADEATTLDRTPVTACHADGLDDAYRRFVDIALTT